MSKNKTFVLDGEATYKQNWKIAHNFANQSAEIFPDYDHDKLAHLMHGTIYYYHKEIGVKLSKKEAADFISNDPTVPNYYINSLKTYLKKVDSKINAKSKANITNIKSLPRD